jgi:ABC-2 type transport system ATP-binding protein
MAPLDLPGSGLAAERVSRSFGTDEAVSEVDLVVMPGQIHALVGLNGAGKTTLMRLLLGMLHPDAGRALVLGRDVAHSNSDLWRRVGHMVDAPFGYPELTVEQNLHAAGRLHGLSSVESRAGTDRGIEQLRLIRWAGRKTRALSAGNRQRLGLACALIHQPTVLILDEPSNALDPSGTVIVRRIIKAAAADGATVLVSSHHLDEMARTADQISVMHRGHIVGSLDPHGIDLERTFFELILAVDETHAEQLQ